MFTKIITTTALTALVAVGGATQAVAATPTAPVMESVGQMPGKATESREAVAARSSRADDMRGVAPSLYRGKFYTPGRGGEDFRLCVINRESNGHYDAANGSSSARGAYQFLDSQWRESLVHMLRPEARKNGLMDELRPLNDKPIHQWSRYWQDAAFWTVYNDGAGAKHWAAFGQTYECR